MNRFTDSPRLSAATKTGEGLRPLLRLGLLIGSLLAFSAANAGSQTGTVLRIITRASDGLHYVFLQGAAPTNRPACATQYDYWMIKDETSATGKNQFAMLLAAYTAGTTITIQGTGTCTRWVDGEDINVIIAQPN